LGRLLDYLSTGIEWTKGWFIRRRLIRRLGLIFRLLDHLGPGIKWTECLGPSIEWAKSRCIRRLVLGISVSGRDDLFIRLGIKRRSALATFTLTQWQGLG
jgi:hypothetical protein